LKERRGGGSRAQAMRVQSNVDRKGKKGSNRKLQPKRPKKQAGN